MDPFFCNFMRPKTSDNDKHSKHKEKCDYKTQTLC